MSDQSQAGQLSASWQQRFDFFDAYGLPSSTPQAKAAYRALPLGSKLRITSNFLAFLFGPIYFFVKGMWRKGLSLVGLAVAAAVVLTMVGVSDTLGRAVGTGIAAVAMTIANYAYYLHVVKNSESWNPFEGFGRKR